MNRAERRKHNAESRVLVEKIREEHHTRRKSGKWEPWQEMAVAPGEIGGRGWTMEVHTAYRNRLYAVLVRSIITAWGIVEHACISTLDGVEVPWRDKQRIKNELFGPERVAVEVLPEASRLVDDAPCYHFFVLPEGFRLPFTIEEKPDEA